MIFDLSENAKSWTKEQLAKTISSIVDAECKGSTTERSGNTYPPFDKGNGVDFQLDQNNDWFLNIKDDGTARVSYRYNSTEDLELLVGPRILYTVGFGVVR